MSKSNFLPRGMSLLYEDRDLLIIEKPAGLLTMATEREKDKTAYAASMNYVKKGNSKSKHRIFIVHRLDRDTSGILIFAKSEEAKTKLQSNWDQNKKIYIAVTIGIWKEKQGKIQSYLAESKSQRVYSTNNASEGKWSETEYKILKETNKYSLVEVNLITGRKNQIRVHFSDQKHPIVGDTKYGDTEEKKFPRMALHAKSIQFLHPFDNREMFFETPIPSFLKGLVGGYENKISI